MPALDRVSDLLYFDNLALYYIAMETPPAVLARVFNTSDARLAGSLLGLLTHKQREAIHWLMTQSNDGDTKRNDEAAGALLIVAEGLLARRLIRRDGRHYFGIPKENAAPLS